MNSDSETGQWLKAAAQRQLETLADRLEGPFFALSGACGLLWDEWEAMDNTLAKSFGFVPGCLLLYVVDTEGRQVSANISPEGVDPLARGQNLADRPYLANAVPTEGFLISDPYVSRVSGRPCITAVHTVSVRGRIQGFLAADFDLRDLSLPEQRRPEMTRWRQVKGDPSIRSTVFLQTRTHSAMDERIDDVIAILEELMVERGFFHAKLHFSSSRATLWHVDDPYSYHVFVLDEIIDPAICIAFPKRPWFERNSVPPELVRPVLERLKALREVDETVYLRAGSLNVVNGMVGLTFSCDGSHYVPVAEFMKMDDAFWFGSSGE